ncbi:FGL1L protein, partial [Grallaria varia]|nr:FGL1L protein [Grallaria varia]
VLALLAPLLALRIENLERMNVNLDDIVNIRSSDLTVDEYEVSGQQNLADTEWPKDCSEVPDGNPSGVYVIQPTGLSPIVVYCEMNKKYGGWTVIQRNHRESEMSWDESWSTYKYGFGNLHTDFWLGNQYIYRIAKQKTYQVRFVIWDASNNKTFADYDLFLLDDESQGYRLRLGSYSGTAEDAMASPSLAITHDNMKFSTKDRDQDISSENCASISGGGWWYSVCYYAQLNMKKHLTWGSLCRGNCEASTILIRP